MNGVTTREPVSRGYRDLEEPDKQVKLVIVGSSTMDGRASTLLRIRPSLMEEVQSYVVGPAYLVIDIALQDLVARLRNESVTRYVDASSLDPSAYDRTLIAAADRVDSPQKRGAESRRKRIKSREAGATTAEGSNEPNVSNDGGG